MSGWVKLHRSLKNWEWYDDHNATRVLIHLLTTVNYEDKKWKGIIIKAGSRVIGLSKFSKEVGLSLQQVRTSLYKLETSGEITRQATNDYTLLSLVKWDKLQSDEAECNTPNNKRITNEQQTNNKRITTTKEIKESKEYKNINKRKAEFKNSLSQFSDNYSETMLKDFFEYWSEHGERDRKMRFEKEKSFGVSRRLATWFKNSKKFEKEKISDKKEKVNAGILLQQKHGLS